MDTVSRANPGSKYQLSASIVSLLNDFSCNILLLDPEF